MDTVISSQPMSFISTAELEMQTAPAVAAAVGGIVRVGITRRPPHDQR
jgi:hypothetical protein